MKCKKCGCAEFIVELEDVPVEKLDIPQITKSALKFNNINHVSDIMSRTEAELLKLRKVGRLGLNSMKKEITNMTKSNYAFRSDQWAFKKITGNKLEVAFNQGGK